MSGFAHHYAEVNGTRLHYVSGGLGPAVVLLHGWPYTWAEWRKLMPLLAEAGRTVIAPDLRGLGDSATAESGYEKSNVAEDVRQVVQSLVFASIDLVGTDIGTFIAFAYAQRYPGEVRRLVLAESLIPGFGLEDLMNPATGGYWHFGFHMQVDLATMLTEGRNEAYLLPFMTMMSASPDAADMAKTLEDGPWGRKYPAIVQSWRRAWSEVIPFYVFPGEVRRILYTTNAIEALNAKLRRAVQARGHFPTDDAAIKLLFLVLHRAEKAWIMPPREWTMAKAQFAILFGERFTKAQA